MSYSLVLDVLMALLLVITIGYAVVLNKKLGSLRNDKAELEKLAMSFANATIRAEESIGKLKSTTDVLQGSMGKAQALRDDLAFLIDRGDRAADRLEDHVRSARNVVGVGKPASPSPVKGIETVTDEVARKAPTARRQPSEASSIVRAPEEKPFTASRQPEPPAQDDAEMELLNALRSAS